MLDAVLILNFTATAFMCGLIWFVQLVHYPLFLHAGEAGWREYHRQHTWRTSVVVAAPMVAEMGAALALPFLLRGTASFQGAVIGAGMAVVLWTTTALRQVPLHGILAERWHEPSARLLVQTNWIRTVLWTGRLVLAIVLLLSAGG